MSDSSLSSSSRAQPCIWMSAGLLTYKLCDRGFDCEHCPLDAALRGDTVPGGWPASGSDLKGRPITFPEGFHYSRGHSWVRADSEDAGAYFFGLDAFAAALVGRVEAVSYEVPGKRLNRGDVACQVDVQAGALSLKSPIAAEVLDANLNLRDQPERVVDDPYESGWILKFRTGDPLRPARFQSAERALASMRSDLRSFRHRVAQYLLDEVDAVGPTLEDGGQALTDLRQILGPSRYLSILRELIH